MAEAAQAQTTGTVVTTTDKDRQLAERFRQAAMNRAALATQLQKDLVKHQQESEDLRKENSHLQARLTILRTSPAHFVGSSAQVGAGMQGPSKKAAMHKAKELEKRVELAQSLEMKIADAADELADLDTRLGDLRRTVDDARTSMGGVFITKLSQEAIERQIKVLENRLDKALVRFNRALDENTRLRREIEDLTRERLAFDSIYRELERELQMKKKKMACVIELSNIAYEERDSAANELAQLKVYAQQEMRTFEETFRELDEILAEDRTVRESTRRRLAEMMRARHDAKEAAASAQADADRPGAVTLDEGQSRTGVGKTARVAGREAPVSLQQWEERFQKLRLKTGVSDVGLLVGRYLHAEDDNFSLFNYVNELNTEAEKLEEQRAAAREALEAARAHEGADFADAVARRRQLKQLEQQLLQEEAAGQRYRAKTDQLARVLEDIMMTIQQIFVNIGCDEEAIVEQHGTAGVSETSVLLYLAAIEFQADRLIHIWRQHRASDGAVVPAGPLRGPMLPPGSAAAALHVDAPSTGEDLHDGDSDGEEAKVLTRAELVARTQQKLAKHAAASGKPRRTQRPRGR
eukprot:TRINITY_DN1248_c0_g1_i2.p1 TRINITY_DN1248_c0_g1~~TRINITY_DN1248_c0_g1_i2.p1  ORF type:complete len:580 (-),score=159.29 TRINITY_DN1248_c0_g1_i2:445-2184(-)